MMHHPLTDLADGETCRRDLAERVDLLLRGHLHETELSLWSDPDRDLREIAAGCLYEHDEYPNACQRIDITLGEDGRPLVYEFRFRAWSPRGFWHGDSSVYREAEGGSLRWPPRAAALPEIPTGVENLFVGRAKELAAMEETLLPGAPVPVAISALQGMPGVGKSYLADHFAHVHRAKFPGATPRSR